MNKYYRHWAGLLLAILPHMIFSQHLIETADRFTNSLKNRPPKHNAYLAIGFTEEIEPYFFSLGDSALLTIIDENDKRQEIIIAKKELYRNRKNSFMEYYYDLGENRQLDKLTPCEIFLSSIDGLNYTRIKISGSDINKLVKMYSPPGPEASNQEKAKYFAKTGNNQGNLMGANTDVVWKKRTKCSVKKRKYGKAGINGVKEMTYGMH